LSIEKNKVEQSARREEQSRERKKEGRIRIGSTGMI
jgi:hypothetical protein